MNIKTFWAEQSPAGRTGLAVGALIVIGLTSALAYWTMRTDYVPVVTQAKPDRLAAAVREIEKLKVPYRISSDGSAVEVPADQLGKVRLGVAGSTGGNAVGFEIFNNSDFSTTEFTQKVNYQRALQGELARTISTMEGIASARVHLVLPDTGYLRRPASTATAAVTVGMQPGAELSPGQVRGIQRLVAASVPEIKLTDIAVLDQAGEALTKTSSGQSDDGQNGRMELKREVDAYLEAKLRKLLVESDPEGEFSVSVDATLDHSDVKVTQEDVVTPDDGKGGRLAGVLVRERQSQRQEAMPAVEAGSSAPGAGSISRETEYRVGRRVEQVATAPGGIDRISVAVVARVSSAIDEVRVRVLVKNAIGLNEARGDSVAVVFLAPRGAGPARDAMPAKPFAGEPAAEAAPPAPMPSASRDVQMLISALMGATGLILLVFLLRSRRRGAERAQPAEVAEPSGPVDIDQVTARVQAWLNEGNTHAAR